MIPPDYSLTPPVAGTVSLSAESAQGQAIDKNAAAELYRLPRELMLGR